MKLIFQYGLYTGKRSISTSFTQSINSHMQPFCTTKHSSQRITYCQIVIVVRMKVKVSIRIAFYHLPEKLNHLKRIKHSQRIRQHKSLYTCIYESIHYLIHIVRRILHSIAPVFQVKIYVNTPFFCIFQRILYIIYVLFRSLMQLVCTMFQ